jgi:hypothetical protein
MAIRTIFSMAEDCTAGRRLGWQEFVRDYAAVGRRLLEQYFAVLKPEIDQHVAALFQRARAKDSAWFHTFEFSNEREFLMAFREMVFAYGREVARMPVPEISLQQYMEIVRDLTLIERELMWMFVKGYDAPQIAPIMMNAAATAEAVKKIADQRLREVVPAASSSAFDTSSRVLLEAAEKAKTPECLSLKTFNNIINGQITWRERELAEEHMLKCACCIDRYTSLNEMIRYRKDAEPLGEEHVEAIVATLGVSEAKPKSLFARLFSRA